MHFTHATSLELRMYVDQTELTVVFVCVGGGEVSKAVKYLLTVLANELW